jgi:hypothetical protein
LRTTRVVSIGRNLSAAWLQPSGTSADAPATRPALPSHAALDEQVILHRRGRLIAAAQVMAIGEGLMGIRILSTSAPPQIGDQAVIIPVEYARTFCDDLPQDVAPSGRIESLGPGRINGWVSLGSADGLRTGDYLLIRRKNLPIALARISVLDARRAAVELTSLVANVQVEPADEASLWPTPFQAATGCLQSVVLAVAGDKDEPSLTVAGGTMVGVCIGDTFEFQRDGLYVGLGEVVLMDDRLCQVQPSDTLSRTTVQAGDRAIRRPKKFASAHALPARIFRIEKGYCLLNVGEREEVEVGQTFLAVRDGNPIARLRATAVKVDYSGTEIAVRFEGQPEISQWDEIYPEPFAPNRVLHIGSVTWVAPQGWAIGAGRTDGSQNPPTETVVGLQRATPDPGTVCTGAAVIVADGPDGFVLYSPRSWRRDSADGACVVLTSP